MIRMKSTAGRQGAEGPAPIAAEARGAEGVGDGLVAVADQQRALQRQRHPLDDPAGPGLQGLEVGADLLASALAVGVEARLGRRPLADLGEEGVDRRPGS